jgi:hypothetical protein
VFGGSIPSAAQEVCAVQGLMIALKDGDYGAHIPSGGLYFEPYNEPDLVDCPNNSCNGSLPPDQATDYVPDADFGAGSVSEAGNLHILAGVFEHPSPYAGASEPETYCPDVGSTTTYSACYIIRANQKGYGQYIAGWSVHDYDDPTDNTTTNWCYNTSVGGYGPYGGCVVGNENAFEFWLTYYGFPQPVWITETGDPDQFLHGSKNKYTDARSATDVEYLSSQSNVAHVFWYQYQAADWCSTPGWDSGLWDYGEPKGSSYSGGVYPQARPALYVVQDGYGTSAGISATSSQQYVEPYFGGPNGGCSETGYP